ncbi:universal stress protein [Streptomyces morookaense]|uniref:Universal stress protein n=1 Tax=Streptomyces morookaense TaxID=1970 RepID=A0A7Y7B4A4_STRMO|nr:universal stress protein [Streptomyces morookaense]NVK78769.1 universal stress protein [Streptomyces morookaense]GHF34612.1 universal stress protein [Streptomyces morookaense]
MSRTATPRQGRVLVGYDGSEHSLRALDRAADEAARRGTGLEVLCGWPWGRNLVPESVMRCGDGQVLHEQAGLAMKRAVIRVHRRAPGLSVTPTLTVEAPARALVRSGHSACLTVLGSRGHGGFAGLLLGSVTLRVAAHTTSPLLVVRDDVRGTRRSVLVGVESDADTDALRFGFEEAVRLGADLRVLHAWQYPASPGTQPPGPLFRDDVRVLAKAAEAVPEFAVAPLRDAYPGVRVRTEALCTGAGHALTEASREADVVVIAAHRASSRLGLQLGPVTHAVLHHAHCPVVLVPTG